MVFDESAEESMGRSKFVATDENGKAVYYDDPRNDDEARAYESLFSSENLANMNSYNTYKIGIGKAELEKRSSPGTTETKVATSDDVEEERSKAAQKSTPPTPPSSERSVPAHLKNYSLSNPSATAAWSSQLSQENAELAERLGSQYRGTNASVLNVTYEYAESLKLDGVMEYGKGGDEFFNSVTGRRYDSYYKHARMRKAGNGRRFGDNVMSQANGFANELGRRSGKRVNLQVKPSKDPKIRINAN